MKHPREVLLGSRAGGDRIPVCDHYCGVEPRIHKSLALQASMFQEFGACVFDVTLDCEDGAPVGQEADHARMLADLAMGAPADARIAVRVHPVDHPSFEADIATLVGQAGARLCHVMVPKVECLADVELAAHAIDRAGGQALSIHALIESPAAVHRAFDIASHPRLQSLSFGLMDFVSAHGGAIPAAAMTLQGQFSHPLVVRAKLEIAAACHAHGKVAAHSVVTEFRDEAGVEQAARRASMEFGCTRMWSIHPSQIRPILKAMAPQASELTLAFRIISLALEANWAPVSVDGHLHDRASYRYFWQLIERAHQTGGKLPQEIAGLFRPSIH